jgi:phosphatidylglycerophosphate synthase
MTDPLYVPERRPIASRERPWFIWLANLLASMGVSPNTISVMGMIAGVLSGVALACTRLPTLDWLFFLIGAAFMQLRLLANMLDGMVALQTSRASPVGELFNEVPDRISDSAILIGAGYAVGGVPELGYLAALAALFTAYIRAEGKVAGAHQEFCGPMAKQQRMALLTAAAVYAGLAPASWQPQLDFLGDTGDWGVIALALLVIAVGGLFTAARRLMRIARALGKGKA